MHKLSQFLHVLVGIESHTLTFTSISACSSGLLVIPFQALRHIIMNDKSYIRLVNTHSKSNRRNNHINVFLDEIILHSRTRRRIHSGMISAGIDTVRFQNFSQFFHFLPTQAINDTGLTGICFNELDNILINVICLTAYLIIKIRTVERRLELLRIRHTQDFLDILTHLLSSSRSQSNNRSLTNHVDDRTDASIFGTEIMPPFRNTMRFIYRIKRNLHALQEFHILFLGQGFRSYIKQLGLPVQNVCLHLIDGRLAQRRVDEMSDPILFAVVAHGIYLIFHQCNQWRDDNCHSFHYKRRQLIA